MIAGVERDTAVVTATMALSGVGTGWLGYRIRSHADVHLITGYRSGMHADTEVIVRLIGRVVLTVAAVTALAGLLYPVLHMLPASKIAYWCGIIIVVVVLSGYAVLAIRQYALEPQS